jgi:type I restriction enzyme S subunit
MASSVMDDACRAIRPAKMRSRASTPASAPRASMAMEVLIVVAGVTARAEKNINMFMAEDYTGDKICRPGDVVFNAMWAWMGALGVSNVTGLVSPSYGAYRQLGRVRINNKYLELLLHSNQYVKYYNRISTGLHSSRRRLYAHMFLGMFLGFPSRVERDEIVAFVEATASKINAGIAIKEKQIVALKEYKTSLINAAVTGKVKVA